MMTVIAIIIARRFATGGIYYAAVQVARSAVGTFAMHVAWLTVSCPGASDID
jgi:hypothetical protein